MFSTIDVFRSWKNFFTAVSFLSALSVPAFALSKGEAASLSVRCEDGMVFTQTEVSFVLEIPHTPLSDFSFEIPELPPGVRYLSSSKSAATDLKGDSTAILHLWFSFSDSGDFRLPPITAEIGGRMFSIPFEAVRVYENPELVSPTLSVTLSPGGEVSTGDEVSIDVFCQYCAQILDFSFTLPKNAILTEMWRAEFSAGDRRATGFDPEKTKIASFVYQPLSEGEFHLPDISIDAISYNGDRKRVSLADLPILVTVSPPPPGPRQDAGVEDDGEMDVFVDAFRQSESETSKADYPEWSKSDLEKLRAMRSRERHDVLFFREPLERRLLEESHGLKDTEDEPSAFVLVVFLCMAAFSFAMSVAMVLLRKAKSAFSFVVVLAVSVVLSVRQNSFVSQRYAVSLGGGLSKVPEPPSAPHGERSLPKGLRVRIVEDMGDWVYIECSENSGWTKSGSLLLID